MTIPPTFALKAHTLLEGGQPGEAISLCEQGLELYPDYATAYTVLAKAYRLTGDIRAAVGSIERGLQRLPLDRGLLRLHSEMQSSPEEQPKPEEPAQPEQPDEPGLPQQPEKPDIDLPEHGPDEKPEIELPEPHEPETEPREPEKPEIEIPEKPEPELPDPTPDKPEIEPDTPEKPGKPEIELPETGPDEIPEIQEPKPSEIKPARPEQPEIELPGQTPEIQPPSTPEIELPDTGTPGPGTLSAKAMNEPQLFVAAERNGAKATQGTNGTHTTGGQRHTHLRVIESTGEPSEMPSLIWRSRNVRLIPGLEFTPLRFEGKKDKVYRRTYRIPDPPPFPDFPAEKKKAVRFQPEEGKNGLTPLEELARRLEAARIPRVEEEEYHPAMPAPEPAPEGERRPAMVSETIARIYEMQGATLEAVRAYETLARQKPEQAEFYLKKARDLKNRG